MPTRARLADVTTVLATTLGRELQRAAGHNALLSHEEQTHTADDVVTVADELRAAAGAGARVTVSALEERLMALALGRIDAVNQATGAGRALLSRVEAQAAGPRVLRAYEVVMGHAVDVDAVAHAHVQAKVIGPDATFVELESEAAAQAYQDPSGRSVTWLVRTGSGPSSSSYVWGRNDLWAERFDVDAVTGAVTVTAEH